MATYVNRNGKVRAVVRVKGETATQTFDTKAEAQKWARIEEVRLHHRVIKAGGMTLGELMAKFRKEILEKKSYAINTAHCRRFEILFSHVDLKDMNAEWWLGLAAEWSKLTAGSRLRYFTVIKMALNAAKDLWAVKWDTEAYNEAMAALRRQGIIGHNRARSRRVTDKEIAAIIKVGSPSGFVPMANIIEFAVATTMRREEIVNLKWADLDDNPAAPMIWVRNRKDPKEKMGNDYNVPLLGNALAIIKRQPRTPGQPLIFPCSKETVTTYFIDMAAAAGIKGIHFHDLRHEGISRMFEAGYGIPEVCLVSGHKNWKTLQNYTHIKPVSLHAGPIAVQRRAA